MQYENLLQLHKEIRNYGKLINKEPVINTLRTSQKYLLISSDPSSDTDKSKNDSVPHSDFEKRVLSLFFLGSDDKESLDKLGGDLTKKKDIFLNNVYWTHYSRVYTGGNPDRLWADKFLMREIELFEPKLIIIFGNIAATFLLGKGRLKDRVNKVLKWTDIDVICCLHPSKNWNLKKRPAFQFNETWKLIRSKIELK